MKMNTLDLALKAAIGLLLVAFAGVVVETVRDKVVGAGDSAPGFSITTDTGQTITRSNFGGRLLVLNFWATWCPPCIEEIPSLSRFAEATKDSGVVVLAVSVDANEQVYRQFVERVRPAFLTARDPESNISSSYGTFQFPETYIIDSKGKVLEKVISNRNWMDPDFLTSIRGMLAAS